MGGFVLLAFDHCERICLGPYEIKIERYFRQRLNLGKPKGIIQRNDRKIECKKEREMRQIK